VLSSFCDVLVFRYSSLLQPPLFPYTQHHLRQLRTIRHNNLTSFLPSSTSCSIHHPTRLLATLTFVPTLPDTNLTVLFNGQQINISSPYRLLSRPQPSRSTLRIALSTTCTPTPMVYYDGPPPSTESGLPPTSAKLQRSTTKSSPWHSKAVQMPKNAYISQPRFDNDIEQLIGQHETE
jgi:hypothetical protein